jgi:hypothetical protein
VVHRPRKYGVSKFGWNRFINGFLDMLSVQFISRYGKKPMQFFGLLGTIVFLLGFIMIMYLIVARLVEGADFGLTNRVTFYLSMVTMVLGTQFFLTGYIAELVARSAADRNHYLVEERIG